MVTKYRRPRTPLKIHGGKHYSAPAIVDMMPRHRNYVEPYFGGGSVLLSRDPADRSLWLSEATGQSGVCEVVNDIDRGLTNFWKMLACIYAFPDFKRMVDAVPFSEVEYNDAELTMSDQSALRGGKLQRAVAFFIQARQSLAGRRTCFTGLTKTRTRAGMSNEVSAWLSTVDGLPAVHARLRRVLILDARPALDVIREWDDPATLFYIDAPYVKATRTVPNVYAHEMTDDEHLELIGVLLGLRGKAIVSMYHHPIYDVLHQRHGWRLREINIANHASAGTKKRRMTECLWTNYEPPLR